MKRTMKRNRSFLIALLAALMSPLTARADVIWDEGLDGDLATGALDGTLNATDLGTLGAGFYDILASLDGGAASSGTDGADESDSINFFATGDWTLDLLSVSGFSVFTFLYQGGTIIDLGGRADPIDDLFGTQLAGQYSLQFVPSANAGAGDYSVRINVSNVSAVPEPSTLAMFGLGLLGLGFARRRA